MQDDYLQGQHRITMRASAMSCSARQGRQITSCSQLAQSLDLWKQPSQEHWPDAGHWLKDTSWYQDNLIRA